MANKPNKIKRSWVVERKSFERDNDNSKFYNSRAWRNFRKKVLERNPLCVECLKIDVVTVATVGDHIIPINQGGEPMDETNVQGLCKKCHDSKSGKEGRRAKGGMGLNR